MLITHERDVAARPSARSRSATAAGLAARRDRRGPTAVVDAPRELARHVPHRDRGGAHPPAALGADDARHPHRHHRGRAHGRPRRGREGRGPGPDQRARHEPARRLAGQLDRRRPVCAAGSARRRRSRVQDADALQRHAAAPDVQAVAPVSTTPASLVNGTTNWTTTLTGTTPSWQAVRSRGVTSGRFITAPTSAAPRRSSCSAPTPRAELFSNGQPVGQTVSYNGVQPRGGRRARAAQLVGPDVEQRPRHRPALAPTRSGWSAARTATRSARST